MSMERKKIWLLRLLYVLFFASISLTVLPAVTVNVHGLFGEVTTSIAVEETGQLAEKRIGYARQSVDRAEHRRQNIAKRRSLVVYLVLLAQITYQRFWNYPIGLPREDTIVTLKVRMDD